MWWQIWSVFRRMSNIKALSSCAFSYFFFIFDKLLIIFNINFFIRTKHLKNGGIFFFFLWLWFFFSKVYTVPTPVSDRISHLHALITAVGWRHILYNRRLGEKRENRSVTILSWVFHTFSLQKKKKKNSIASNLYNSIF